LGTIHGVILAIRSQVILLYEGGFPMAMIVCAKCGLSNITERRTCKQCGTNLHDDNIAALPVSNQPAATFPVTSATVALSTNREPLPLDQRKAILENAIAIQARTGWLLVSRTDTTAQMTMEKRPSGCIAIILFLLGIVPGIIYLMLSQGTATLYIEVDEYGSVRRTTNG
jgi:hypothetical protein